MGYRWWRRRFVAAGWPTKRPTHPPQTAPPPFCSPTLHLGIITALKRLLVISLAGIGDTLMATPLLHELRLNFPDAQIEALLGQHPAIAGSGVIGREDAERGQVPVAFICLTSDAGTLDAAALEAWCRSRMASYKVPEIRIVQALPMTATGKILKRALKK